MSFTCQLERANDEATLFVGGAVLATDAADLFSQITHLMDQGYPVSVDFRDTDFLGLGAVRALQTASFRAHEANLSLQLIPGRAVYRVADLVGRDRWAPLRWVSLEDETVAV